MKRLLNRISLIIHSIRFRLALWFVVILGIVVTGFSAFIYIRQSNDLQREAMGRLELKTQRLVRFLRFIGLEYFHQSPLGFPQDPSSGEALLQEGDVLAFINPDGRIIDHWGPMEASTITQLVGNSIQNRAPGILERPFPSQVFSATAVSGVSRKKYFLALSPMVFQNQLGGYFLIGNPVDAGNQLPRLMVSLILGVLATLAVALAGGFWLADRAMRPVKMITQTAQTIHETDLSRRMHLDRKDELGELANTFDDMLSRLQAAFERQRQFTADASHELRTPLTIVELESSRALSGARPLQEYERVLKVIQSENQFMTRLVNNLLTLARMDAGQIHFQKQELDLSEVALEVIERLAPLAADRQVRLVAGELPELLISGDAQYLAQMLTNLVENAIKYVTGQENDGTEHRGDTEHRDGKEHPRVEVSTGWREAEHGRLAWARVVDNGPGIAAEHLPHLFARFYQVDKARSRQVGEDVALEDDGTEHRDGKEHRLAASGAGLGLSIAQWIAKAHGGEIQVQSDLGKGSIFEVSFPLIGAVAEGLT